MRPLLDIGIPSIPERAAKCELLKHTISAQMQDWMHPLVNVRVLVSKKRVNGGPTITQKRRMLAESAKKCGAKFHVQIDDDDMIHPDDYLFDVLERIAKHPDMLVLGHKVRVSPSNKTALVSAKYSDWKERHDGFDYAQAPYFKVPIATELWLDCMPPDHVIWQEDAMFSKNIVKALKARNYQHKPGYDIDKFLYEYIAPQGRQNPMTRY